MKISNHAKLRMRERTNFNHKERRTLFRKALDKGKNIQDIKDDEVKKFVTSKQNKCLIKLYQDYLYIYSRNSKKLYTMYKLPDNLQGKEEYK